VQRIRGRANGVGAALQVVKRGVGRAAGALDVRRANVGDIGFNLDAQPCALQQIPERVDVDRPIVDQHHACVHEARQHPTESSLARLRHPLRHGYIR
jgi:hypothetical protein